MTLRIPSSLTDEQIAEFQRLFKNASGKEISKKEAESEVLRTLSFLASIIDDRYQ